MYYGILFFTLALFAIYTFSFPETRYFHRMKTIAFLLLLFTSGLRYETAVDYYAYEKKFEYIEDVQTIFKYSPTQFFLTYPSEPGFTIVNSLVKTFTENVAVLFFLISLFTTFLLFNSLTLYSSRQYFFLSILLYYVLIFFILDMSGVRQCIALNIVLYSFRFLIRTKNIKFILFVLLASMFHFSALLFIVFPLFINIDFSKKLLFSIIIVGVFVFIFRIRWLTSSIESIASLFPDSFMVLRVYSYTTKSAIYAQERPIYIMLFVHLFLYLFMLVGRSKYLKSNLTNTIFFNMFSLYMIATLFFWEIADFGIRFGLYFSIGVLFCLPQLVAFFKQNSKPIIVAFIILYSFVNARQYIIEDRSVIPYNPYQNYIVHEVFNLKSTGPERLDTYLRELGN